MAARKTRPPQGLPERTKARKTAEWKAWIVSFTVHAVLFCLLAATGFFLLVREQPQTTADDVVDITMLTGGGGNAGGSTPSAPSAPPAAAPSAAPVVALPVETALPEIAETYTKEPEKQQAYRQEHHAETPAAPTAAPSPANGAQGSASTGAGSGSAGSGTGTGQGAGTGFGSGVGTGSGSGAGDGIGSGDGTGVGSAPAEPPAPVDAAAYCTYRAVPSYPASMVQAGAEGSVTILITVSPESSITDVSVVSSSGYPALDAAAVAAGWACRFSMNGHPGRYRTTYRFELQGDDDW
ncbi:TonB family protein [Selenomonas sp.]|uniref:TonB family protein n=1 Tax=Selenomonas sp. TaxID=2053611 RepID=UPI0025F44303|nr:TonB family protein [Selenomonas sp.]MCI6283388.1 energy transducer TonB [Selenomonas sp.]